MRLHLPSAVTFLMLASGCPAPEGVLPTPDEPPTEAPTEEPSDDTPLLITEVMADNQTALLDGLGDASDWIELYNPGVESVQLDGWTLTDDPDSDAPWPFPERLLLPGEFVVVFAALPADDDEPTPEGELRADFALSADGEQVVLARPDGSVADELVFPALAEDRSYGRAQTVEQQIAVAEGSAALGSITPPPEWMAAGFDDSAWLPMVLPVGYDRGGSTAPPINVALGAPTDQSSDGYGLTGVQAVDGDPGTFSHTGDADLDSSWSVDLGGDQTISEIRIFNRIGCCPERLYNITVEVLDPDGDVTWSSDVLNPIPDDGAPTDPGALLTVLPDGAIGTAVRVQKHAVGGAGSTEWMSLAEVEVMATAAAPYESFITTDVGALMADVSASIALRVPFEGADFDVDRVKLEVDSDDGFVAWIDGEDVARSGATGENPTRADAPREAGAPEIFPIDPAALADNGGTLALLGLNVDASDDDFLLRAELTLQHIETLGLAWFVDPTPGEPNGAGVAGFVAAPLPDTPRGFADAAFVVTLSSETPGASMAYTLDGTVPSPDHGVVVTPGAPDQPPVTTIDVPTTTLLRAVAWREGWQTSPIVTHTWLFLADVVHQSAAPVGFPAVWDGLAQSPANADYEMDPEVADDPTYAADLLSGLRDIPSLSIVMDPEDLFGAEEGIYVHSQQRGREWERPASIELILPDGSTGFATTCGARIHGYGWRPHANTKKHAMRLEFRSEYGPTKLEYPWFVDAPVDRFDSIVLRSQGSRGWQDFRDPEQSQYLRDAFARDTARDMGKADGHATFVHLYLNGLYWGLYNPVERPDARFGAEYFGGDAADYDAINRRTTTNEAIDGDLIAYDEMLALADAGLASDEAYAAVLAYLDVVDLIDYMLIHQYTANRDGPEEFQHNNMRGIRRREPGAGFRFFVWDMEYSLWGAGDHRNIDVDIPGSASHVYAMLRANEEFRALYDERARLHLLDGGALTAEACLARYDARADEIFDAVVAESARWGDTDRATPYTRDVEWATEYARLTTEFFPFRTDVLIDQLLAAGLME